MNTCSFRFHDQSFIARPSGALFWPERGTLIVSDLHLGKSARMARQVGALLPPFETRATLERLATELRDTGAASLISLGDSFDDDLAIRELGAERQLLDDICQSYDTLWITGNHDPAPVGLPGRVAQQDQIAGLYLRHIADDGPDISGHYHPKLRLAGQRLPAFLIGDMHLILPAFGVYTGGLDHDAPTLAALVPQGRAVVTGRDMHMVPLPLPRVTASRAGRWSAKR